MMMAMPLVAIWCAIKHAQGSKVQTTKLVSAPPRLQMSNKMHLALRVSQLIFDPVGRGREPLRNEPRPWLDPMMATHAAFVPAIFVASRAGMLDLVALQSLLLFLSTAYHYSREVPGALAQFEGTVAKALFVYGLAQLIFNAPENADITLYAAEIACAVGTLGTFIVTNIWPDFYERYHPLGLHIVPGFWSFLVASFHSSLLCPLTSSSI